MVIQDTTFCAFVGLDSFIVFTLFVPFTAGFLLDAVALCTALALRTENSRSHEVLPTGPVRRGPARPTGHCHAAARHPAAGRRPPHPMAAVLHLTATSGRRVASSRSPTV